MSEPRVRHNRVIIVVALVLALAAIIACAYYNARARDIAEKQAYRASMGSAAEQIETLHASLDGRFATLEAYAEVVALDGDFAFDAEETLQKLAAVRDGTYFLEMMIAGTRGVAYGYEGESFSVADRWYFHESIAGRRAIERIESGHVKGGTRFVLSVPLVRNGRIAGVAIGTFAPSTFEELLVSETYARDGYSFLCDSAGDVVVTAANGPLDNIYDVLNDESVVQGNTHSGIEDDLKNGREGYTVFTLDGEDRFVVYAPTGINDWTLFNIVPESVIKAMVRESSAVANTITLLIFLLSVGMLALVYYEERRGRRQIGSERADFRAAATQSGRMLRIYDVKGDRLVNAYREDALSWQPTPEKMVENGFVDGETAEAYLAFYASMRRGVPCGAADARVKDASGVLRWYHADYTLIPDAHGAPDHAVITVFDNEAQMRRAEEYAHWSSMAKTLIAQAEVYLEADLTQDRIDAVQGQAAHFPTAEAGARIDAFAEACVARGVFSEDAARYRAFLKRERLLMRYYDGVREETCEVRLFSPGEEGEPRWFRVVASMMGQPAGGGVELLVTYSDVDREKREQLRLIELSQRDSMTGLLNREAVRERIAAEIKNCAPDHAAALYMIDLDYFKQINDHYGHQRGDEMLMRAAGAISGAFRTGDIVGRTGGDEFMAFMSGGVSMRLAQEKAKALLEALQFSLGDITLTSSIGIVYCTDATHTFEQLYDLADGALYRAKDAGRHGYLLVDAASGEDAESGAPKGTPSEVIEYKTLLEQMEGGVFLAEVDRADVRINYVSPSVYKSTHRSREEIGGHGENALALVYAEDLPALLAAAHRTAETGEVSDETYRVGADGQDWRHIRMARLSVHEDGSASIIGALSIMTEYKRAEEQLRLSEERYRIADELSGALIWEVDIATHTLTQSAEAAKAFGHSGTVYRHMPDGLLAEGAIHPASVAEFRRLYADIYAGTDGGEYIIQALDDTGAYIWLRAAYRLIRDRDGTPIKAVGIAEKVPNVGTQMRILDDEERFADAVSDSMLGVLRVNLTKDVIERFSLPMAQRPRSYSALYAMCGEVIHPDDAAAFAETTKAENLRLAYDRGNTWQTIEYRRRGADGAYLWTSLTINLLCHPVSRDVFAFGYYRNIHAVHRWEGQLPRLPEKDGATLLYTREAFLALSRVAAAQAEGARISVTVLELLGFDRVKGAGVRTMRDLLFTAGRICRVVVGGDAVIAHTGEAQFAVFRTDVDSAEEQREAIRRGREHARLLIEQTMDGPGIDLACGFVIEESASFDAAEALRRATVACGVAQEQGGDLVGEYADPGDMLHLAEEETAAGVRRRVLVADDDPGARLLIRKILGGAYDVEEAANGAEALELLRKGQYALLICDLMMPGVSGWDVLDAMRAEKMLLSVPAIMITADHSTEAEARALNKGASDVVTKPVVPQTLLSRARNIIGRQEATLMLERNSVYELRFQQQEALLRQAEYDEVTGLLNRYGFYRHVRARLDASPETRFHLIRWDIDNFKVINDALGMEGGDRLLGDIGAFLNENRRAGSVLGRLDADHFMIFLPVAGRPAQEIYEGVSRWLDAYPFQFKLSVHMGVYEIDDPSLEVSLMCDRALLALKSIKGSFTQHVAVYDASLRERILEEQALTNEMATALAEGQFTLYFQPQVNYADGTLSGAEALVRWQHPTRGLLSPDTFVPLFERNGFISKLDAYVWEQSCRYMRKWIDQKEKYLPVSVSVNISRVDIYDPELCAHLNALVARYGLPASYLRLEITESAYMRNPEQLIAVVKELRAAGFTVEMDDFGAGYSSLNTLKDVPVNVLKLDIRFLSSGMDDSRGGSILSSVIRMAHWLDLPIIAEGVETKAQAEYLKSLNCFYMQGYLFGRPMPADAFERLLDRSVVGAMDRFGAAEVRGASAFWDPSAQEALLFNEFVGAAAIVEYHGGRAEVLRANDAFYREVETTREAYFKIQLDVHACFDEANWAIFRTTIEEAIRTGGEAVCETQSKKLSVSGYPYWTRNRMRLLAANQDGYLLYAMVENISERKAMERELAESRAMLEQTQGGADNGGGEA